MVFSTQYRGLKNEWIFDRGLLDLSASENKLSHHLYMIRASI